MTMEIGPSSLRSGCQSYLLGLSGVTFAGVKSDGASSAPGFDARCCDGVVPLPTTTVVGFFAVRPKSNCAKSYGIRTKPELAG